MTDERQRCGMPCLIHDHDCDRSPRHTGVHRDVQQKGDHSCEWGPPGPEDVPTLLAVVARLRAELTDATGVAFKCANCGLWHHDDEPGNQDARCDECGHAQPRGEAEFLPALAALKAQRDTFRLEAVATAGKLAEAEARIQELEDGWEQDAKRLRAELAKRCDLDDCERFREWLAGEKAEADKRARRAETERDKARADLVEEQARHGELIAAMQRLQHAAEQARVDRDAARAEADRITQQVRTFASELDPGPDCAPEDRWDRGWDAAMRRVARRLRALGGEEEAPNERAGLKAEAIKTLRDAIEVLEQQPCVFWACKGPDAPFEDMVTCQLCAAVQDLRKVLATAGDGEEATRDV
ncbi:hypothetical protein [Actinomadura decatromicini]|uniref:Uncharacterized protein n=1 Tax=Actinomadura decatromicini TaxID=2604572 RepID=A0A5D3FAI6_9ACTN|nr:hypothetical protein [Actinomadura decatromicini]TYK45223.1 hypothetical protein FXF68_31595 [Actinomadura decatromicini]